MKNPDVNGVYEEKFNSEDYNEPEFQIEVTTSFGEYKLNAYNVFGGGFVISHDLITNTLAKNREELDVATKEATDKLEHSLDTMI